MRMRTKPWARPELAACPYYIDDPEAYRGKWHSIFKKAQPIHIELGCGKGLSLAKMAKENPHINYIGIDSSMDILGVARRNIAAEFGEKPIKNLVLSSINIEHIHTIFSAEDVVDQIYIYFCNPWPKARHQKRRLTHPRQLIQYKEFLSTEGEIHFKTDNLALFEDSIEYFYECSLQINYKTYDLHTSEYTSDIMSEHEIMFTDQGINTKFLIAKRS